jgi:predicted TIM-barrel enzyme
MTSTIYAIATMDTKGAELAFVARMPEDAQYILDRCAIEGFYGASSMERLPTEKAITAQVGAFMGMHMNQHGGRRK